MADVILAVLDQPDSAAAVLAAAGGLAERLGGATMEALAVRLPAEAAILPTEEVLTAPQRTAWDAAEAARMQALRAALARWQGEGGQAAWRAVTGDPAAMVAERGRRADWVVLARPDGGDPVHHRLHAALFETGRPVLVVPDGFAGTFGRRVAIGFKADGRAEGAILAAMPLLARAEQVRVYAGTQEGAAAAALPAILSEHGIAARRRGLAVGARGSFGAALLEAVAEDGGDLLVMGAYAHSRWREMLLGGVTRHVLAEATIPVLMRH